MINSNEIKKCEMFLTKEVRILNKRILSVVIALTLSVIMNGTVLASPSSTNSQISIVGCLIT